MDDDGRRPDPKRATRREIVVVVLAAVGFAALLAGYVLRTTTQP